MTNPLTSNASRLRLVLSITLVLLIGLGGSVIVFGVGYLRDYAKTVNSVVAEAESSSDRIDQINQDIVEYKQLNDAVTLAEQVVAQRESYQYQDNAYKDLLAIASRAGVSIEKYTFSDTNSVAGASSSSKTNNSASSDTSTGLKPTYITITLTNPVNYVNFLNFIHYIEQNLTKMQIKKISLSSAFGTRVDNAVLTDELTLEVYTQ